MLIIGPLSFVVKQFCSQHEGPDAGTGRTNGQWAIGMDRDPRRRSGSELPAIWPRGAAGAIFFLRGAANAWGRIPMRFEWPPDFRRIPSDEWTTQPVESLALKYDTVDPRELHVDAEVSPAV